MAELVWVDGIKLHHSHLVIGSTSGRHVFAICGAWIIRIGHALRPRPHCKRCEAWAAKHREEGERDD